MWGLVIDSEAFDNIERHLQRLIYHQKCYSSMMDGRKQLLKL